MRRFATSAALVAIFAALGAGIAVAAETQWFQPVNAKAQRFHGLAIPTDGDGAIRLEDVAVGVGYLKSPGTNTLPLTASAQIPGSDVLLAASAIGYGSVSNTVTGNVSALSWDFTNLREGIRTSAPAFQLHLVDAAAASDAGLMLGSHQASASLGQTIYLQRSRGTFASPAAVTTSDYLGRTLWQGYSGTSYLGVASMGVHVNPDATVTTTSVPATWWVATGTTGGAAVTDPFASGSTVALSARGNQVSVGLSVSRVSGAALSWAATSQALGTTASATNPGTTHSQVVGRTSITSPTPVQPGDLISTERWYGYNASSVATPIWHIDVSANTVGTDVGGEWELIPSFSQSLQNIAAFHADTRYNVAIGNLEGNATSATSGFAWLPNMAGPPTGVAAVPNIRYITPSVSPIQLDTTNRRLYLGTAGSAVYDPIGQSTRAMVTGYMRSTTSTGLWSTVATIPYGDITGAPAAITALTGDATAAGPGSAALTFATVNASPGTYPYATVVVNGKGLATTVTSGATPALASRTITGTSPVLIEGDNAAHDLSANRTISFAFDNTSLTLTVANALQRAALTGDVTASAGSNATTIAADAVTYAKLQNISAASRVLCRGSAGGAGDAQECTLGAGITMSGTTISSTLVGVTDGDKGDITVSSTGATWTIDNGVVSFAKQASIPTDRLVGRDTAGTGDPEALTVGGGIEFTGSGGIQTSAFTGDATKTAGGTALTLATVGGGAGSCSNCSVTFDAKGRQTAYSSGTAPVTSVSGTSGRISSTGGATPVLDLVTTAVTPGSYTATNLTVDAYGRITAASNGSVGSAGTVTTVTGTAPIFITSTPTTTPNVTIQGAITTGGTSTSATNLGAQGNGVLMQSVSAGVSSPTAFGVGAARIPFGSGTTGFITDLPNLAFNGLALGFGALDEVQVYNASTNATAFAGFRASSGSSFSNNFGFGMTGTNWSGGSLSTNAGLIELNSGSSPMFISNVATGKISFTTTASRTERMAILTGGDVTIANRLGVGTGSPTYSVDVAFNNASSDGIRATNANTASHASVAVYAGTGGGLFRAYGQTFAVASLANHIAFGNDTGNGSAGVVVFGNSTSASGGAGSISLRGGGYDTAAENLLLDAGTSYFSHGNVRIANNIRIDGFGANGLLKNINGSNVALAAAGTDYQAPITWPLANRVAVSSGPSTDPVGNAAFQWDITNRVLFMGNGSTQKWANVGNLGDANAEYIESSWASNVWSLESKKTGTGTVRAMRVTSTAGVTVDSMLAVNGPSFATNDALVVGHTTNANRDHVRMYVGGGASYDSADNTFVDIIPSSTSVAGTLGILATQRIRTLTYVGNTFNTADEVVGLHVAAPDTSSFIDTPISYAIHATGIVRVDAGFGGAVFELPQDSTGNTSAATGRIPIIVNGTTRWIRYYND